MKIFITGTSSGIGKELAELLAREGHKVWGIARRPISSAKFRYSQCDVTDREQVKRVAKEMEEVDFLPDVVVLGSAVLEKDLVGDFDFVKAKHGFVTNYEGALIWVEKFLPKFLERGSGKFIAVSSTSAFRPSIESVSLPASKAALSMAFRSLHLRYHDENIKFTTVYFGPVATLVVPEFITAEGKKKYFFVLSVRQAAEKLKKAVLGNKYSYYFPFWLTIIFRVTLIFPDTWFSKLSGYLKK